MKKAHTLAILVRNRPGVLTKIAGMFYRRNYNIKAITAGKMHIGDVSKIVITVPMDDRDIELLRRQIENLVDVE
jgi:acetolactate synthase-1/3 small subunit